jgi:hypothetical protein
MTPYTGIFLQSDASLYVKVPAPATDLKIARAKLLYMLIKHHGLEYRNGCGRYRAGHANLVSTLHARKKGDYGFLSARGLSTKAVYW